MTEAMVDVGVNNGMKANVVAAKEDKVESVNVKESFSTYADFLAYVEKTYPLE